MSFFKVFFMLVITSVFIMSSSVSAMTFYKPYMESHRGDMMKASIPISLDGKANETIGNILVTVASRSSYDLAQIPYNADVSDIAFSLKNGRDGFPYISATSKSIMTSDAYRVLVKIENKTTGSVVYQDFNLGTFSMVKKEATVMRINHGGLIPTINKVAPRPRLTLKRERVKPQVIALGSKLSVNPARPVKAPYIPSSKRFASKHVNKIPATYKVKSGDILTQIAKELSNKHPKWNIWTMSGAIYELNKGSFGNGNINLLKRGSLLKLPSYYSYSAYAKYTRGFTMAKISDDADLLKSPTEIAKTTSDINPLDGVGYIHRSVKPMPVAEFQQKTLSSINGVLAEAKKRNEELIALRDIIRSQLDKITALEERTKLLEKAILKLASVRSSNQVSSEITNISNPDVKIVGLVVANVLLAILILVLFLKKMNNAPSPFNSTTSSGSRGGDNPRHNKELINKESINTSCDAIVKIGASSGMGVKSAAPEPEVLMDNVESTDKGLSDIMHNDVDDINIDDLFEDDQSVITLPDNFGLETLEDFDTDSEKNNKDGKEKVEGESLGLMKRLSLQLSPSKGSSEKANSSLMSKELAEIKIREAKVLMTSSLELSEDDLKKAKSLIIDLKNWSPDAFRVIVLEVELAYRRGLKKAMFKIISETKEKLSDSKWDIFLGMLPQQIITEYSEEAL